MIVFLEGGPGNGEVIEITNGCKRVTINSPFFVQLTYEITNPLRLHKGRPVFVQAEITIPAERLEVLE